MIDSRQSGNGRGQSKGNGTKPSGPQPGDLLAQTQQDLLDEGVALRLLHHMARLFDRDRLLQTVAFPLEELARAIAAYLASRPDAFRNRVSLDESLAECAWFVLPPLLTDEFVGQVRRHIEIALRRRRSMLDRKALATALILSKLGETPQELASNGLWSFLFRRSLLQLLELPSRELDLEPEVRDALRAVPLSALHEPPRPEEPSPTQQAVEDVYHGLEAGYLREHLGFSYVIRFPFTLAVLFPQPGKETRRSREPEAEDRLMMATVESVAREGAQSGVVDEMLCVYRRARDASSGDRERHFYTALVTVLEAFEPEENPVLPALFYEHYLYYLSGGMQRDREVIRDILNRPLDAETYDRYIEILRDRKQQAAVTRVEKIRDEVRAWQHRNS
jgi:hypothetical protein